MKKTRTRNELLKQHKVTPFLSNEKATEMRELAQLRGEIKLSMLVGELISDTEWMERSINNDPEDESIGDLEDESVSNSDDESEGKSNSDDNESEFGGLPAAPAMEWESVKPSF